MSRISKLLKWTVVLHLILLEGLFVSRETDNLESGSWHDDCVKEKVNGINTCEDFSYHDHQITDLERVLTTMGISLIDPNTAVLRAQLRKTHNNGYTLKEVSTTEGTSFEISKDYEAC